MVRHAGARWNAALLSCVTLAAGLLWVAACATSASSPGGGPSPSLDMSTPPPSPDPRVGLQPGRTNPGQASWNLRLVSNTPSPTGFVGVTNSDLAFAGNHVIQGNYNGFIIWDIASPGRPRLRTSHLCPASQSDVSVFRNLLFVSGEGLGGRVDCGAQGVPEPVSRDRLRGIRVFDITDITNPRYLTNVQTCRGSHTHSVVTDPNDNANVYIYVSGSAGVRPADELAGCSDLGPDEDPNSSLFRIEVIRVPLAAPQTAHIVSSARIFSGLSAAPRRAEEVARALARGGDAALRLSSGPNQCHDITTYPGAGFAGGACQGYGILLDIRNPAQPRRVYAVSDSNFAAWHSVTFNNDGTKVLFTDEWGGGSAPRCRAGDNPIWGGNAIFRIVSERMEFQSYYKMPAAQTETENCVAHNGSLIPIPGRDIKVQGWYQGGISIFEWTDPRNPVEIAFFDRGPLIVDTLRTAGSWSAYWYNGYIYSSEIARGLDVLELQPSGFISQNEIDAAKTVRFTYYNTQEQQRIVWPASFVLARAYLDQLQRSNGLAADRIAAVRTELGRVERLSGQGRRDALTQLATQLNGDAQRASDTAKVRTLATVVRDLAAQE
ncbi:MAG: hypothetical protein HY701_13850 [Gemmatimonadetes bacterium]|nr:hypothetical protein [Gemmatimonadota bacterium]